MRESMAMISIVELTPVNDSDDDNFAGGIVDLISDASIAHANAPHPFFAPDLQSPSGSRVGAESENRRDDPIFDGSVQPLEFSLGP